MTSSSSSPEPSDTEPQAPTSEGSDSPESGHTTSTPVPRDLPGGLWGRSWFMRLDDTERAAYESLHAESAAVWAAWITGDLDAAERLDALDDEQRTRTTTALGLEPTPRPAQQAGKLTVASRRSTEQGDSAGEKLIKRHQGKLDQNPAATQRFPPMRSSAAAHSTARSTTGQQRPNPTRNAGRQPRGRPGAPNSSTAVVAWVLIIVGIAAVAIAQAFGRDSVDMGFGVSLSAQEPWAQPLTWGGAALAVVGIAILLTKNRAGSSSSD